MSNPNLPVPYLRDKYALVPRMPPALVVAAGAAIGVTVGATAAAVISAIAMSLLSVALSFVMGKLLAPGRPKPEAIKNELRQPTSLPFKRFCYGEFYAPGSPAPWRVKGNKLYGMLILNSRPSDGSNVAIRIGGRDVALTDTANLTDFASAGAVPSAAPYAGFCQFWLGLGDQTAPPTAFTTDAGDIFDTTDAWNGITVLFAILDYGPQDTARDRWSSIPPEIEVSMRWSKVWDFTDVAQSLDDDTTWTWSDNHALCLCDAHTQNPIQPYQEADLDIAGGWTDAATAADEAVTLAAGGTEPRYVVGGLLVFNQAEMAALFEPMFAAGASEPTVIGGQTSIVAGVYQAPSITATDIIGAGYQYEAMQPGRDIANTIRVTYRNPERREESAELPPYSVAGAVAADGGVPTEQRVELADFVTSPTQAARVQKIMAHKARAQKRLTWELPPANFNLVAGASLTIDLDSPHDLLDGVYQVEEITPVLIDVDEGQSGGVAMRLPCVLREYSSDWFSWGTDEEPDIPEAEPIPSPDAVSAPGSLTVTASTRSSGGATITGATLEWPPVDARVVRYETQYRETGGDWLDGPDVSPDIRDASGDVVTFIPLLETGEDYDFRVRAVLVGRVSPWREALAQTMTAPANALSAPTVVSAAASGLSIDVTFTAPNEAGVRGISFYAGDADNTGTMALLEGPIYVAPNTTVQITESGLSADQTRWYAARTVDEFDGESAFSATVSATTDSGGA